MNHPLSAEINLALEQQNFSQAILKVQDWLQQDPNSALAYVCYGDILMQMASYAMAAEQYEKAIRLEPASSDYFCRLGIAYAEQELWSQAFNNFKTAWRIDPGNPRCTGLAGWALWYIATANNDLHRQKEAQQLLADAYAQGIDDQSIKDALAESYLNDATQSWPLSKEKENSHIATHYAHLVDARRELAKARALLDGTNTALNAELNRINTHVDSLEKREFFGYPYMRKAPLVVGGVSLLFGMTGFAVLLFLMAGLYHFSQYKPGYLANRKFIKGDYGDPFWVRRIDAVGQVVGNLTFFSTSLTNVMFMSWAAGFVAKIIQYFMAIIILPILIVSGFITNYDLVGKASHWMKEKRVSLMIGLALLALSSCGGIKQFSENTPYALELKRVRSYFAATALTNRLDNLGLETYMVTLQDETNPDNKWYAILTGAEKNVEDISALQKTVADISKLTDIKVLDYRQVEKYITEVDQASVTELEKIVAERPDIPEDVYSLIEKFPKNDFYNVRFVSLHNFPEQPIQRKFLTNYYDTKLDLPRGISKNLIADNAVAFAEVIFEDNLYGDQVTIDLLKLAPDHQLDLPTDLPVSAAQLANLPVLPRTIGSFLAAKILGTGRYLTEEVEIIQLNSFIELYGFKVVIEPRQGYLRTYVLLFDENGEFALFSQSTDKTDEEILSYLQDFGKSQGMLAYNEFYNTFFTIPKCLKEGDVFLGYSSSILDDSYAYSKGYANWAKAMVGHPESTAHFYNTILRKSWSCSAFDLLTLDKKDYIYHDMYSNSNQGDKVAIDVKGQSGFFVRVAYLGYNEVNFATAGRHVMALGGYGMSQEELQQRAGIFQTGINGESSPCPSAQYICGDQAIVDTFDDKHPDYHKYDTPRLMLCEQATNPRCTQAFVYNVMLSNASFLAPTDNTEEVFDCQQTEVAYNGLGGPIRTKLDRKNFTATNYTLPGHSFHPGKVTRSIFESGGKIYVKTTGEGTGPLSTLNDNRYAMATLWSTVDGKLKAEVARRLNTIQ